MLRIPIVAAVMAVTGTAAVAQTPNYMALSMGSTQHQQSCAGATVCDKRGSAFRFYLGQPLTETLSAEIGYVDLGRARTSGPTRGMKLSATGIGGGLAIRRELASKWVFGGRVGLMATMARGTLVTGSTVFSGSEQSINPYFGLSAGYKVHPSMTMDLSFEGSRIKFNRSGMDASRNTYSLLIGAVIEF